jgi:hypothetical protein
MKRDRAASPVLGCPAGSLVRLPLHVFVGMPVTEQGTLSKPRQAEISSGCDTPIWSAVPRKKNSVI